MIDVKIIKKSKTGSGTVTKGSAPGAGGSLASVVSLVSALSTVLVPVNASGARVAWDSPDLWAVKSVKGFYSEEFVSARGANPDPAGGIIGATSLADLTDVALSNPVSGQTLVYNGTKWVNQAIQTGLDTTQLASYLTTNNYAKKSDIPSLTGYATETWVTNKGYLEKTDAAALYQPKGDYLTDHQAIHALTLQAGVFSAETYNPKTGAATVKIPTTTSHISEDTNLFFTSARAVAALKPTTDVLQTNIDGKLDATTFNDFKTLFDSMFVKEADANSPLGFRIKAKYGLYTEYFLSARGVNPDGSSAGATNLGMLEDVALTNPVSGQALVYTGTRWVNKAIETGLDTTQLASYLTTNNYAKKSDIPSLTGYATETWVGQQGYLKSITMAQVEAALTGNITSHTHSQYLTTTAAASTYVAQEAGKGLSANDFTDTLLSKLNGIEEGANKYVHPTATATTIAAATGKVVSAITVDSLGHVTSVASKTLAAADIPALAISKITGLQTKLDSKLDKGIFDDLFEKVNIGTASAPVYAIKAKFGFYSEEFISARGMNGQSSSISKYLTDLLDTAISAPVSGQALVYNGSKWVNQAIQTGLDTTQLASYLTTNNYAKKSDIPSLSSYMRFEVNTNYVNASFNTTELSKKAKDTYIEFWDEGESGWFNFQTGYLIAHGKVQGTSIIKQGGTSSQVLMADGSVQSRWKSADISTMTDDNGMVTPLAVNNWVSANFYKKTEADSRYLRHTALNGGLIPSSAATTWGNSIGTLVAEWTDSTGNCAFKFKKDNPSSGKMSMLIDGTVYINEGADAVASQSWVTGAYVKKAGDTMSGTIATVLKINSSAAECGIGFRLNNVDGGWVGYNPTNGVELWNYKNSCYLGIKDDKTPHYNNNTLWHAGNDGPGSGLDADLLDGVHNGEVTAKYFNYINSCVWDCNNPTHTLHSDYGSTGRDIKNTPTGWYYGQLFTIGRYGNLNSNLSAQFIWDVQHDTNNGGVLWFRTKDSVKGWKSWQQLARIIDTVANANSLGGVAASQYARITQPNNFVHAGNEITMIPAGFTYSNKQLWINYRCGADGSNANFNEYVMGNGTKGGMASVRAISFIRNGGTSSQFLKADGSVDANSYLTTGSASSTYVKKAGDTMSGSLSMGNVGSITNLAVGGGIVWNPFVESSTDSTDAAWIKLIRNGVAGGSELQIQMMNDTNDVVNINTNNYNGLRVKGSIVWNQSNDGSGSGLDADLLDGYHNGEVTAKKLTAVSPTTVGVTVATAKTNFLNAIKGNAFGNVTIVEATLINNWNSDSTTVVGSSGYSAINVTPRYDGNTYGQFLLFHYASYNPKLVGRNNGAWTAIKTFAFLDDNVASATQLATARTLWGQSFNGTGNVSGNMTGVGTIYCQGTADSYREGIRIKPYSNWSTIVLGGNDLTADSGTSANTWGIFNNNGTFYINKGASSTAQGARAMATSTGWTFGNTTRNTYALNAASFICDSWVRTVGATGWYNESYGGGWYMSDTTWIRTYGKHNIYASTGIIRTDGQFQVGGDGSKFYANSSGVVFASAGVWSNGYVSARGQNSSSDERLKSILRPLTLNIRDIANAPSVEFVWKKDGIKDVGSIAQYWRKLIPQLAPDMPDGTMGLQYGKTALMSVIAVAKKTVSLEERVAQLERENRELKAQISQLKIQLA